MTNLLALTRCYRLSWRRPVTRVSGRRMFVVDSVQLSSQNEMIEAVRAASTNIWAGELRVEGPGGARVFTSSTAIACWDGKAGTMPAAVTFSLWEDDRWRAAVVSELLANLRSAFARPVTLGMFPGDVANSIVAMAERAAADPHVGPI